MRDLTLEENALIELLGTIHTAHAQLPEAHPWDVTEFMHHIHALQNIILARPATEVFAERKRAAQRGVI